MAEGIISNLPPEFSRRDELDDDARDPRRYEELMCRNGYLVGGDREYGDFLRHFVWLAQQDNQSRDDAKEELATMWEHQPDKLPWPTPPGVDYSRIANALVEEVWPTPCWSEGTVDTSEIHIGVVYGGCLDEEPERVAVALVGPDRDDGVIVEFLPMPGVDPETAEGHKSHTLGGDPDARGPRTAPLAIDRAPAAAAPRTPTARCGSICGWVYGLCSTGRALTAAPTAWRPSSRSASRASESWGGSRSTTRGTTSGLSSLGAR